jgi:hypothetical protein
MSASQICLPQFGCCPGFPCPPNPKSRVQWEKFISSHLDEFASSQRSSARPTVGGTPKNKWTPNEDAILEEAVTTLGTASWRAIADKIPGRTGKQCRERWIGQMDPKISHRDWSPEEDLFLIAKQRELGHQWAQIRQFLPGRSILAVKNRFIWLSRREEPKPLHEFPQMFPLQDEIPRLDDRDSTWSLPPFEAFDFWVEPDVFRFSN